MFKVFSSDAYYGIATAAIVAIGTGYSPLGPAAQEVLRPSPTEACLIKALNVRMSSLTNPQQMTEGFRPIAWDAVNGSGRPVSVYVFREGIAKGSLGVFPEDDADQTSPSIVVQMARGTIITNRIDPAYNPPEREANTTNGHTIFYTVTDPNPNMDDNHPWVRTPVAASENISLAKTHKAVLACFSI